MSFDDILAFSKSIDLLDKGYIESASNLIKETLDESPDFEYANKLYQELLKNIQIKRTELNERMKKKVPELIVDRSEVTMEWTSQLSMALINLTNEEEIQLIDYIFNNMEEKS